LVEDYNHTPHNAFYGMFTPFQVQFIRDFERYFIKENEYKLEKDKADSRKDQFKNYKPGSILLIHLDLSKNKEHLTNLLGLFLMILVI
jgi:hypothetical protein